MRAFNKRMMNAPIIVYAGSQSSTTVSACLTSSQCMDRVHKIGEFTLPMPGLPAGSMAAALSFSARITSRCRLKTYPTAQHLWL